MNMSGAASNSNNKGKGKILKRANPSTIQDKFLVGYQGWFTCAGDGEPVGPGHHGWLHWFNYPIPDGGRPNTDIWPDVSSYSPSELFPAPGLKTKAGEQVFLFSSRHPKTVQRHFHWMAEHGVDGAFLQRFAGQCDLEAGNEGIMRIRDEVGDRVREAAEKEGRVFAIMYDVSGVPADRIQRIIERDWLHLIHDKGVLDSPNYLREKGKPVVALWGFGFDNAHHTPALVRSITSYIRRVTPGGAYIFGGTPTHWRTAEGDADRDTTFRDVWLEEFDAISPWTVGRYGNEREAEKFAETRMKGDIELIKRRNEERERTGPGARKVDYVPVVLPGGSGFNLSEGKWGFNDIKRDGGRFLWKQIFHAKRHGARTIYGAMWDEYDEGTAFMPVVTNKQLLPVSDKFRFMALDEDGYDLPADWYMRICGFAAEGLHSERRIHETFPSKELQDYWSTRPQYEDVDPKSGDFVSGAMKDGETAGGASGSGSVEGGGGQSYQDWLKMQKEDKEDLPPPPYSLEAGEEPQPAVSAVPSPQTAPVSSPGPLPTAPGPSSVPVTTTSGPPLTVVSPSSDTSFHASGSPPINASSRPLSYSVHHGNTPHLPPQNQQPSAGYPHTQPLSPSLYPAGVFPTQYDATSAYQTPPHPSLRLNNATSMSNMAPYPPPTHVQGQDPVSSLANDFSRHGISGPTSPVVSVFGPLPPPLHPAHPAAAQTRPQSQSRPGSRPHSQGQQAGYGHVPYPTSPMGESFAPGGGASASSTNQSGTGTGTGTGGSHSQGQWPPPEWGIGSGSGTQTQTQTLTPTQSTYQGENANAGANLSRPHTISSSSYASSASLRPHASISVRPSSAQGSPRPGSSHSPQPQYVSSYGVGPATTSSYTQPSAGPAPPFHGHGPAGASSYMPSSGPSFPSGPSPSASPYPASSYPGTSTSSYPGQVAAPASSYPSQAAYLPTQGYGAFPPQSPPPSSSSASFPATGSYYPGQSTYTSGAGGSTYPGQMPYGSSRPPVHGDVSSGNGGIHFPQAPGSEYFNIPQPAVPPASASYAPSYITPGSHAHGQNSSAGLTPYGTPSPLMPTASTGWYPGQESSYSHSGTSTDSSGPPPIPPRPPTHTPYTGSSSSPGSGPAFPTAHGASASSSSSAFSSGAGALGFALDAVDKVAGKKTRAQLETVAQSGSRLFSKFTK